MGERKLSFTEKKYTWAVRFGSSGCGPARGRSGGLEEQDPWTRSRLAALPRRRCWQSARDRRCGDSSCRWMWEGTKEGTQVGTSYYIKTSLLHHDHFEAGRGREKQYFVVLGELRVGAPGLEGLMWERGGGVSAALSVSKISPLPSSLGTTGFLP